MKSIFTRWISGALFILLGLLIAIGPQTAFKPCSGLLQLCVDGVPSDRYVPMKCHWSAAAEIGFGGVITFLGLLLLLLRKTQQRFGLSSALTATGIAAILIPTKLIGVCAAKTMQCNILMLPMLLVLSSLVVIISLVNVFLLFREAGKEK